MPALTFAAVRQGLLPWEAATGVALASRPGVIAQNHLLILTLACWALAAALLVGPFGLPAALVAGFVFGRLAALDLTTYTLPNVYTVPLVVVGLCHALLADHVGPALLALASLGGLYAFSASVPLPAGVGGGDLKLLAALFAFLPAAYAFTAIAVGCLLWLPLVWKKPRQAVPMGVPVLLGWLLMLQYAHLPKWLFSTIS